jgi:hypothetical protein
MHRTPRWTMAFACVALAALIWGNLSPIARADDPLHARIDALVAARLTGPAAAMADDSEFLRRVWLDLAGRVPPAAEARAFLADPAPDKRARLIDRLLDGPDYPRRMREQFHVMLMERQGDHPEWQRYLLEAFANNRPWDQMARDLLCPDAEDTQARGAAFFFTKRLENYGQNPIDLPGLTRDVGRLFLGVDVQCAQCHDHLFIDDYKQADFQGLFAFVGHTFIRGDKPFPAIGEKPVTKKIDFMSVFLKEPRATGPRLPGGGEVEIPVFAPGEEFAVAPDPSKGFPGVPKFSPLNILAQETARPDNHPFARNIVNRLWSVMLGRGLVHPLDQHHTGNPASHPELLELLAAEFVAHGFDIKWLLREVAMSQTYQRSSLLPDGVQDAPLTEYRVALERPLSAEQLFASVMGATGEADLAVADFDAQKRAEDPKFFDIVQTDPHLLMDALDARLAPLKERFLAAYANPPKEPEGELAPSVKAALFLLNDGVVLGWLNPRPGNLVDRLGQLSDPEQTAEELYLAVLTRFPTPEERAEVAAFLSAHADQRPKALGQLAWALLASTEFCVNH